MGTPETLAALRAWDRLLRPILKETTKFERLAAATKEAAASATVPETLPALYHPTRNEV